MARHRLRNPCFGVAIPIVLAAVAHENTTNFLDPLNQANPLHEITSSSTFLIPGIWPLVMSR